MTLHDAIRTTAAALMLLALAAAAPADEPEGARAGSEPGTGADPVLLVSELYPAVVPAGRPLTLQVHGEGFTSESRVWIQVNLHAGTARLPEYDLRPFDTEFVDPGLLEVELDRGFYPVPGARDVVVEGAGGARSAPAVLTIRLEDES